MSNGTRQYDLKTVLGIAVTACTLGAVAFGVVSWFTRTEYQLERGKEVVGTIQENRAATMADYNAFKEQIRVRVRTLELKVERLEERMRHYNTGPR